MKTCPRVSMLHHSLSLTSQTLTSQTLISQTLMIQSLISLRSTARIVRGHHADLAAEEDSRRCIFMIFLVCMPD